MASVILKSNRKCDARLYQIYDERLARLKLEDSALYEKFSDWVDYCCNRESSGAVRSYAEKGRYLPCSPVSFEHAIFGDGLKKDLASLREYGLVGSNDSKPSMVAQAVMQHRLMGGGQPKYESQQVAVSIQPF